MLQIRIKSFNPQIFLEILCYCAFAGLMLYLIGSGKHLSYVTPRMEPYILFSAIVMGIWALVSAGRLFRPRHRERTLHCLVLAIPNQTGQGGAPQGQAPSGDFGPDHPAGISNEPAGPFLPETQFDTPDKNNYSALPGLDTENKRIAVSNHDFGLWISEIYMNMEQQEGYTVTMTGFIFKDPEMLGQDAFVPARLMMTCCVADLVPAGLLCQYDKVSELENDTWVTVEGTLFIGEYGYYGQVYDDPQINVTKITPAEVVEGYIYPY